MDIIEKTTNKTIVIPCLLVICSVLVAICAGQWPMGHQFYNTMNQMVHNLNNMAVNLQAMGERFSRQQDAKVANDMLRAQTGVPFGNGGMVFVNADGGLGYAYNSSDGSITLYSLGSGSPPSGYMYSIGPLGTSYRSW